MASSSSSASSLHSRTTAPFLLCLQLLLIPFLQTTLSQAPSSSSPDRAVASCQPQLLSLVPCAPFVQGTVRSPAGSCCDNLDRIYRQQPNCICLLLSSSEFNSLPINSTLASQLPHLCHLQGDASVCSGVPATPIVPAERAPSSTTSQVSFGAKNDPSIAASPRIQVAPRPSISGSSQDRRRELAGERNSACLGVILITFLMACPYF